jgi:hypothetical protein
MDDVFRGLYSKLARGGGESLFRGDADDDDDAEMGIGWDMAWRRGLLIAVRELDNNQRIAMTSLK